MISVNKSLLNINKSKYLLISLYSSKIGTNFQLLTTLFLQSYPKFELFINLQKSFSTLFFDYGLDF